MKRSTKRLVSVLICLAMAFAMLPLTAFAAGTTTVYCQAPAGWTNCNAYWWGSSAENPTWPGVAMSQDADGVWAYDVPSDATGLIFNNGSSQTADLTVPTDDKVMYVFENSYWTTYGKVEVVVEYFVAGSGTLCGVEWDPGAVQNKMTANADGTYSITYTGVAADTYELKVTTGSWVTSWGEAGTTNNYILTVADDDSTVVVSFDPATELVSTEINPVVNPGPDPVPNPEGTLIAEGTVTFADRDEAFNGVVSAFVPAEDGTVTIEVSACDSGFFVDIYQDGEWVDMYEENAPMTISYIVTKGVSYEFVIGTMEELMPGLMDYAAGSVTYKVTADVAAGEPSQGGGENPGEGGESSEANPMPIGSYYGDYIPAGQTVWFIFDNYEHMMQDGVYSQMLHISAGVPYSVTYRGADVPVDAEGFVVYEMMDIMYQGTYVFSVTNNGTSDAFFTVEVKDRPAYIVSEYTLVLGDNAVAPDPEFDNTLYEFTPEETGIYTFTISEGVIGNWGTIFNPVDNTGTKDAVLQWTCTAEGQSVLIGVAETEEAVLTIEKTGDYVADEQVEEIVYENTYGFTYQLPENPDLVAIDVLDDKADVAVLDNDGFYRYGSKYGPLMVADLNEFPINLADAYINGQLRAYVLDDAGKVIARYDYNEAMNEYLEAGLVPVTEELARMLKQVGDHHGWWDAEGFVFEAEAPTDAATAWMVACSYVKGSELDSDDSNSSGNQNGGNQNGGSQNNSGNQSGSNGNPKTRDISMAWTLIVIAAAATCLVIVKKKEAFFLN